jgi:hypothetical protein
MIILMAVMRASDRRGSGLICPMSRFYAIPQRKMQAPCGGSVPMAEKLRYDRNALSISVMSSIHLLRQLARSGIPAQIGPIISIGPPQTHGILTVIACGGFDWAYVSWSDGRNISAVGCLSL